MPCSSHTTAGAVSALQIVTSGRCRSVCIVARRAAGPSVHRNASSGLPKTSSGAATIISSSCCTMCTENSSLLTASTGDTSAAATASQPAANAAACAREMPRPAPALRQARRTPMPYSTALAASRRTTSGSNVHACQAAPGATALGASPAGCISASTTTSLLAGIEHQPRNGEGDDHERRKSAEHEAEQRHEAAAFVGAGAVLAGAPAGTLQRGPGCIGAGADDHQCSQRDEVQDEVRTAAAH